MKVWSNMLSNRGSQPGSEKTTPGAADPLLYSPSCEMKPNDGLTEEGERGQAGELHRGPGWLPARICRGRRAEGGCRPRSAVVGSTGGGCQPGSTDGRGRQEFDRAVGLWIRQPRRRWMSPGRRGVVVVVDLTTTTQEYVSGAPRRPGEGWCGCGLGKDDDLGRLAAPIVVEARRSSDLGGGVAGM
ncbi:hypothetical protein D1007_26100 [Hordeum vulgare]|nr:hypothetical protein D1007_26100 [Hordeum vulgare]